MGCMRAACLPTLFSERHRSLTERRLGRPFGPVKGGVGGGMGDDEQRKDGEGKSLDLQRTGYRVCFGFHSRASFCAF
jgi:hypothetical protein